MVICSTLVRAPLSHRRKNMFFQFCYASRILVMSDLIQNNIRQLRGGKLENLSTYVQFIHALTLAISSC